MRLAKRIATCAVAAVLSVSMLTACGGDAPAASSSSSSSAASSPASSSASSETNSASSGASSSSSSAASSSASSGASSEANSAWDSSYTSKYSKLLQSGKVTMSFNIYEGDILNSGVTYAVDGANVLYEDALPSAEYSSTYGCNVSGEAVIYTSASNAFLVENGSKAVAFVASAGYGNDMMIENSKQQINSVATLLKQELGTYEHANFSRKNETLNNNPYVVESYTATVNGAKSNISCYYLNGELKYIKNGTETLRFGRFDSNVNFSDYSKILDSDAITKYTVDAEGIHKPDGTVVENNINNMQALIKAALK